MIDLEDTLEGTMQNAAESDPLKDLEPWQRYVLDNWKDYKRRRDLFRACHEQYPDTTLVSIQNWFYNNATRYDPALAQSIAERQSHIQAHRVPMTTASRTKMVKLVTAVAKPKPEGTHPVVQSVTDLIDELNRLRHENEELRATVDRLTIGYEDVHEALASYKRLREDTARLMVVLDRYDSVVTIARVDTEPNP